MIIISKEVLQYKKDNVNYYINFPKIYTRNETDESKLSIVDRLNNIIFDDIIIFMEIMEDAYGDKSEKGTIINTLTEFNEGFNFYNVISIAMEFSQLIGCFDISYIKTYNYDIDLKREIKLKDLFKSEIDYLGILRKLTEEQIKIILNENPLVDDDLHEIILKNIFIDCESVFYFTEGYLILPFSSFEMDVDIMNLIEVKIAFNKLYPYLNKYAIKKIVHKVIL